ncbi:hypothetical protein GE107_05250 [Cohnella sp. CFH 77786]|uniref:enoyl-CoA hydratase/isomerase family protein n=1 Tax=Cohnella sp. CFH 77786 TaxID=2662265 RepID=UPI001C60F460|nr:enoyl-CoA hydratase-related protein [Cohnella sp. CFH 77786]MBW5445467.1 hypothetical protein [Cohnella sp. CFH 77786]
MTVGRKDLTVWEGDGARLVDLGGEVACLGFRSSGGTVGPGIAEAIRLTAEEVERNWRGLVLAGEGRDFSAGTNLMLVLMEAENGDWDEVDCLVREIQDAAVALRRLRRPVVAVLHGLAVGAGAELCLAADRVLFDPDTRFGVTGTEAGLIPAAGGCLAAASLAASRAREAGLPDSSIPLAALFESMAEADVSRDGGSAVQLRFARPGDRVLERGRRRLEEAKRTVLELSRSGVRRAADTGLVPAAGRDAAAGLKLGALAKRRAGHWNDHDAKVAIKLADVLTGGDVCAGTAVSEEYMLDLEREAFLSLCGEPQTRARIRGRLEAGNPLRQETGR